MRPSPIQIKQVVYSKIIVEPNDAYESTPTSALNFDFLGVNLKSRIGHGLAKGQEADPKDFFIELEIGIDNKQGKATPYRIEIAVLGLFTVLPSLVIEKREDLVVINGASILYGIIREMTLSLTSRFASGPLTLPGINFEDHMPSQKKPKASSSEPTPPVNTRAKSPSSRL